MNGAPGLTLIERLKELGNGLLSNSTSVFPPSLQLTIFPISLQHLPFSNFFPQNTKMCFASERCGPFYCTSNSHMRFECNQTLIRFGHSKKTNRLLSCLNTCATIFLSESNTRIFLFLFCLCLHFLLLSS